MNRIIEMLVQRAEVAETKLTEIVSVLVAILISYST